ncbi:hypothetical protein [Streptomyces sp. GC420]|nr:hypothetical protein [Streptomyces sp. GC420]
MMAEHPHAELVRKGYEAFSRGSMEASDEFWSRVTSPPRTG